MDLLTILKIVSIVLGVTTSTVIPTGIGLLKAVKAKQEAATEAATEKAKSDMITYANTLIETAEQTHKQIDKLMKTNGLGSTGAMKKESVMTKLQAYAIEHGYTFDAEEWSEQIDEIVKMTKAVNSK